MRELERESLRERKSFDKNTKKQDTKGGGVGCIELYEHTGTTTKKQKRIRGVESQSQKA